MKIAIIGTRGIPNRYGGFEQITEFLSEGLVKQNHSVYVYNSHTHPYQEKTWKGVHIIHCYDPEHRLGTAGQFIYDLNCILDARKRDFDILLFLGYTSSSVWQIFFPRKSIIVSNMDGLEWKRSKYSRPVQRFLMYAEKLAVKYSDYLIADSVGIQHHLKEAYHVNSEFIAYGAHIFDKPDVGKIATYDVTPGSYDMLMARMEPENNIEMILDGYNAAHTDRSFIVIGNTSNKFGTYIREKFSGNKKIRFIGSIYDQEHVNNLRYFSNLYFHGHSVGGTNPSLLEAMASNALIAAHDNIFNLSILLENGFYFSEAAHVTELIEKDSTSIRQVMVANNVERIKEDFAWDRIISSYEKYLTICFNKGKA